MASRLALFLDGTTDTEAGNTNVWRVKSLCAARGADGKDQKTFYRVGVGTAQVKRFAAGCLGLELTT